MAVLSIQSQVVFGYAGNTAAVFPLQRLGREVWAINTVAFSNHTGYGSWRGKVLGAGLASELVAGLGERGVLGRCEAVLSGYLGDADLAEAIKSAVRQVRSEAPAALYCCDPVMGDIGRGFYVKNDIPGIIKNTLIPLADIATPNQFELEALTGISCDTLAGTRKAVDALHEMGPSVVLVTSYRDDALAAKKHIGMLASGKFSGENFPAEKFSGKSFPLGKDSLFCVSTPELPLGSGAAGTGDITAAVFLSRYLETRSLKRSLELCAGTVYGILEKSFQQRPPLAANTPLELLLVAAQDEIAAPSRHFEAYRPEA